MTAVSIEHSSAAGRPSCDLSGVVVIIPALNEEAALPLVLGDLPAVGRVIVVDNGSSDETAMRAIESGAEVRLDLFYGQEPRRPVASRNAAMPGK